jgi:ABC-type nickel/cobalt efflux system permease component RcnA
MTAGSILAALNVDLPKQNRSFGPGSSLLFDDVLLIVGVGLGLLLILSAGIYLWMKTRRKRRKHVTGGEKVYRGHEHGTDAPEEEAEEDIEETDADEGDDSDDHHDQQGGDHAHDKRRYKYRVRRRTHRSRNPTLSETGGLPPVKSPEPGKPG